MSHTPAKPVVKKMRWPFPLVWVVPVFALAVVGYYFYDYLVGRGTQITITFAEGDGLKPGQTSLMHLGVPVGEVTDIRISPDQKQVLVSVRLKRSEPSYAKKGAMFWVVRPQISTESITGLSTVLSGPYIDSTPGGGDAETEFTGLERPPVSMQDGLRIVLKAPHLANLPSDAPIYFRGVEVGVVQDVLLSRDAATVDVHALIRNRYSPLVKSNSQFWIVSGIAVKGGLFTGVQMKVESLRSIISGGIAFATPEKDTGDQAQNGSEFVLHEDAKKDWLDWAPRISIAPDDSGQEQSGLPLPRAPETIGSAVK
jgi:paraquat-inducible protein B